MKQNTAMIKPHFLHYLCVWLCFHSNQCMVCLTSSLVGALSERRVK